MSVRSLTALAWEVCLPPRADSEPPSWLDGLEAFRARVLYDGGRRPNFKTADGRFVDDDPVDLDAYHVIASSDDGIAGCFRVVPLATSQTALSERLLGAEGLDRTLARLGVVRAQATEGGGWAVDPSFRRQGLGVRLLATGVAVAERLGLEVMLGPSGVRDGQYRTLAKIGWRPVPGLRLMPVPKLADEICIGFAATMATSPRFRALVDEAAAGIGPS